MNKEILQFCLKRGILLDKGMFSVLENFEEDTAKQIIERFSNLKEGDFIIQERDSAQFQKDCHEDTNVFLESGRRVISGLKSLGVTDGKLHEILPGK